MKTNIKDMTFVIPLRIDSHVRLENLVLTVKSLLRDFDTHVSVLEATSYQNGCVKKMLGNKVEYLFIEDKDPVFYRTKYLNMMTRQTHTPFVGIWDSDVIIPKEQIIDSIIKLRQGVEIAYPYDGHFYDTTNVIRELYFQHQNTKFLLKHIEKMYLIYRDNAKGGAMLVNKEAYINAGMENERFYGWGSEDTERFDRWKILGLTIHRSKGPLFHLTHSRGNNSVYRSQDQLINTNKAWAITRFSTKSELLSNLNNVPNR